MMCLSVSLSVYHLKWSLRCVCLQLKEVTMMGLSLCLSLKEVTKMCLSVCLPLKDVTKMCLSVCLSTTSGGH